MATVTLEKISETANNRPESAIAAREFGKKHMRSIELDMDLSNRFDFLRHTENELALTFLRGYTQCLEDQRAQRIADYGELPG